MKKSRFSRLFTVLILSLIFAGFIWVSCDHNPQGITNPTSVTDPAASMAKASKGISNIMAIQDKHTERLLAMENVIGTATTKLSNGQFAIKLLTKNATLESAMPRFIENVPVVVEIVGDIRAQGYTGRYRPVKCGVSGGSAEYLRSNQAGYVYDGGTIGCVVQKNGTKYFLSNNHVFAHSNRRDIGDGIVQPGLIDNGGVQDPNNLVAVLSKFKKIKWKPLKNSNVIDAAIAEIMPGIPYSCSMKAGYTPSSTVATATIGLSVKKCGRTTGLTTGTVTGVNVTVVVNYMPDGYARYDDQVQFTNISDSGDSGSLIVTQSGNQPVALLFAGSSSTTFGNPIQAVLDYFHVTICSN